VTAIVGGLLCGLFAAIVFRNVSTNSLLSPDSSLLAPALKIEKNEILAI
jgi:hypothetical protein